MEIFYYNRPELLLHLSCVTNFVRLEQLHLPETAGAAVGEVEPLTHLPRLTQLTLNAHNTGWGGWSSLGRMSNLRHLGVSGLDVQAAVDACSALRGLMSLRIVAGEDMAEQLTVLRSFSQLRALTLCDYGVQGMLLLSDLLPGMGGGLESLDLLPLHVEPIPAGLPACTRLTHLRFMPGNTYEGLLPPQAFRPFLALGQLRSLELECMPTSSVPPAFADLTSFTHLMIRRCSCATGFERLAGMRQLQSLDLYKSLFDKLPQDTREFDELTCLTRIFFD
ncbi:hypothetical protein ABPG75_010660 [Micractinium tetrahymenae]